jgi:hypothetical protein
VRTLTLLALGLAALPTLGPPERGRPTQRTPAVTKDALEGRWGSRLGTTKVDLRFRGTRFELDVGETTKNGRRTVMYGGLDGGWPYAIDRKANLVRLTDAGQARLVGSRLRLTLRVAVPSLPKGTVLTLTRVPEGP